ncbi:hypothetical protein SCH01S_01_00160 [Sphingomonas changbaiensis NBRC 104936]|uniref:HTH marR-type domain-containing protein n=1 Tax=Sphingomonas changbaiensis NBRC 104936 TaxID=1219043 RepID=A0A0E9MK04_9SPHN|nr:hypothetical protein [Sphingomonas changbaiensis]GAO37853.1 hypothetical protein SCH01S_01_00160 [Sphingomonas changbaiensis NBRC 104936]
MGDKDCDIDMLVARARREYRLAGDRCKIFGQGLFADPAWNILLDLVISQADRRDISVTAACIGSRAPAATASRYIAMLLAAGLIEQVADVRDGRRKFLHLTPRAWDGMMRLLG